MSSDKERTIGIILPNITNHFSANFFSQITDALAKEELRTIVSLTGHRVEKERELFDYFHSITNGILVLSSATDYEQIADVVPSDIPVIFFNRKPEGCDRCCILASDYAAVYQAVISMERSGHNKIACICDNPDYSTTRQVVDAYRDAMTNSDIEFHEDWIYYTDNQHFSVEELVDSISAKGCDAVLTATQTLTEYFQDYLVIYNKDKENKLYLTGYSNDESQLLAPKSIDVITQPVHQIVQLAVQQLRYLWENPSAPAKEYLLKGTLRVRRFNRFEPEETTQER